MRKEEKLGARAQLISGSSFLPPGTGANLEKKILRVKGQGHEKSLVNSKYRVTLFSHLGGVVYHMDGEVQGENVAHHTRLDKTTSALQQGRSEDGDLVEKTQAEGRVMLREHWSARVAAEERVLHLAGGRCLWVGMEEDCSSCTFWQGGAVLLLLLSRHQEM